MLLGRGGATAQICRQVGVVALFDFGQGARAQTLHLMLKAQVSQLGCASWILLLLLLELVVLRAELQETIGTLLLHRGQRFQLLPHGDPLLFKKGQFLFKCAREVVLGLDALVLRRAATLVLGMVMMVPAHSTEVFSAERRKELALWPAEVGPRGACGLCLVLVERCRLGAGGGCGCGAWEEARLDDDLGLGAATTRREPSFANLCCVLAVDWLVCIVSIVVERRPVLLARGEAPTAKHPVCSVERVTHYRVLQLLFHQLFVGRFMLLLLYLVVVNCVAIDGAIARTAQLG